jgi:hypothetical protein
LPLRVDCACLRRRRRKPITTASSFALQHIVSALRPQLLRPSTTITLWSTMLLPSALSCDSSHRNASSTRFQSAAALFTSPPASPPPNSQSTLFATCRALQSMLSSPNQLPTPPMTHAPPPSPFKLRLRLRSRKSADGEDDLAAPRIARRKITKRNNAAPRGINKRRRAIDDDATRDTTESDDNLQPPDETAGPSTPKRVRLAPEVLPMGLERSDFHKLQAEYPDQETKAETEESLREGEGDSEQWSSAEDRLLVELVLEKLKLSKSDWQDCARSLGKDRGSVGRRWKSLMGGGEIGLKSRPRRGKIHATWRS